VADLLVGLALWATTYKMPYVDRPLYCGQTYTDTVAPWVAVPVSQMGTLYECGDLVILRGLTAGGEPWWYQGTVQDVGPLSLYCIETEAGCEPIGFDIPAIYAPFPGLSARVTEVWNISAEARAWRKH